MSFYDNILGVLPPAIGADDAPSDDRAPPQTSGAAFLARWPAPDVAPGVDDSDRRSLPSTFYDNILGLPLIGSGNRESVPKAPAPARPQAPALAAAPQSAGEDPDHDTVLHETLRAAGVPPDRLCSEHLVCAANLMANEGLAPADAYERVVLHSARDIGLVEPDDWQDAYGLGAGGEAPPASSPPDETPEQRDLKRWPATQASMNEGRETGPSDSGAFAPAVPAAMRQPNGIRLAGDIIPRNLRPLESGQAGIGYGGGSGGGYSSGRSITSTQTRPQSPVDPGGNLGRRDSKPIASSQAPTSEGRETGLSDSRSARAEQLSTNRATGRAFEQETQETHEQSGEKLTPQITLRTKSGRRARLDFLTRDRQTGEPVCIECKASDTARLTPNQKRAFPEIEQGGATVAGKGKPAFSGGTIIPPTAVQIKRP